MRRALRLALGLPALWTVAVAGGACHLVLDLPEDTGDLSKVAQFCECGELQDQHGGFSERCAESMEGKSDSELIAIAEDGCDSCGDAVAAGTVAQCYAGITGAGAVGEACQVSADCASFACCATLIAFEKDMPLEYGGTCCDACYGCTEFKEAVKDSDKACGDALVIAGDVGGNCLCPYLENLPAAHECRTFQTCGFVGCAKLLDASCLECLFSAGACLDGFATCDADPSRPVLSANP